MKIALLSPLPPYRGGISQFGQMLLSSLERRHCSVTGVNYSHLYPDFVFPGRTQYQTGHTRTDGIIHSYNPFTWKKTRREIVAMQPELVISQWWHPFFAPCLTSVIPKEAKSLAICHNILPHENFPFAQMLSDRFFSRQDFLIVHSSEAAKEAVSTGKTVIRLFHPVYNQYVNTGLPRRQAREKLGLGNNDIALLFFGLVRRYKGLDILIEACNLLPERFRIIAAGENYTKEHYQSPRLLWQNQFIPDSEVGTWFNAADIVVLPYREASQSGISQIALAFGKPMVVTNRGGLPETVDPGTTGTIAVEPTPESIAAAVAECSELMQSTISRRNIEKKAAQFSWSAYVDKLLEAVS